MAGHVRWSSGLGLRGAGIGAFVGAVLLGISLWPAAHEITLLGKQFGWLTISEELVKKFEGWARQFQAMPLWLILVTMAIVPAVFEELCFRGFLFSALRRRISGTWTVVASAALFGFFHEVFIPGKLVSTTALGLVLGWARLRTGSILPGILLHAMNNGLLLSVIYYKDALAARGWGIQEQEHLPLTWHVAAALGIAMGAGLIWATTRRGTDVAHASSE
jgi:ABC-2 type transport system permease protein/sodium transport system permease protein